MPNIETYLAKIREAVYGEEVRGSIHDAIQAINDEVDDSEQVALKRSIASTYSSSSSYAVGDYVFYPGSATDGVLYKCVVNIPTGEAWNSSHWSAVTLSSDLKDTAVCRFLAPPANVTSCDDVTKNSWYFNSAGGSTPSTFSDFPFDAPGFLQTIVFNQQAYQMAVNWNTNAIKQRLRKHGTWGTWMDVAVGDGINEQIGLIDRVLASNSLGIDINERRATLVNGGITCEWDESRHMYHIYGTAGSSNVLINIYVHSGTLPDGMKPGKEYCWYASAEGLYEPQDDAIVDIYINKSSTVNWTLLQNWYVNGRIMSAVIPSDTIGLLVRYRVLANKTVDFYSKVTISNDIWSMPEFANHSALLTLEEDYGYGSKFYPESKSCDDIKINSVMFNSTGGPHGSTFIDFPFNTPGWIWTYHIQANHDAQFAMSWSTGAIKCRVAHAGEWQEWKSIGGENVYNITQEINRDEISNTYNITTSPTITTDTNNYLQAIDNESTPESSATDMTGAIMSMLNSTGHCKLGPGVFYVSGSIDMPNGSSIEGCGNKTIVRLLSSVSSGYILRIKQYNTVKDIHFSGGTSIPANLYTDGTNMGSRHGIYMIGNADGEEAPQPATAQCEITNCWFDNFDGSAFYAHNTGGGLHNSVIFSDSHIEHCRVGLNIDYYNEYAKYSHLVIYQCYYACINNGGNNIFTGCTFHGVVGWLTDNSNNDKRNNQHGSCVGCTFNHIDNMNHPDVLGNGKAVHIINGVAGFIFTGCQLWYGNVYIENSLGVQFSDCLFGNNRIEIEVTGSWPAFFFNNIFWTQPTLNLTGTTVFKDNYLRTGGLINP